MPTNIYHTDNGTVRQELTEWWRCTQCPSKRITEIPIGEETVGDTVRYPCDRCNEVTKQRLVRRKENTYTI